jgi:hypothetical protein
MYHIWRALHHWSMLDLVEEKHWVQEAYNSWYDQCYQMSIVAVVLS